MLFTIYTVKGFIIHTALTIVSCPHLTVPNYLAIQVQELVPHFYYICVMYIWKLIRNRIHNSINLLVSILHANLQCFKKETGCCPMWQVVNCPFTSNVLKLHFEMNRQGSLLQKRVIVIEYWSEWNKLIVPWWRHFLTDIYVNIGPGDALFLIASRHHQSQCYRAILEVQWHLFEGNLTRDISAINHQN